MKRDILSAFIFCLTIGISLDTFGQTHRDSVARVWWKNRFKIDGDKVFSPRERENDKRGVPPATRVFFPDTVSTSHDTASTFGEPRDSTTDNPAPPVQAQIILRSSASSIGESMTEPTIAVSPVDQFNFVSGYMRVLGQSATNLGTRWVWGSATTDGGATWFSATVPPGYRVYEQQFDPTIVFDATGDVYYCYADANQELTVIEGDTVAVPHENLLAVVRSQNKGSSWDNHYIVVHENSSSTTIFHDKPTVTCDQTNGSFRNYVYVTWTRSTNAGNTTQILLRRKKPTDFGFVDQIVSVSSAQSGNVYVQGSSPVVAPDGNIYVFWTKLTINLDGSITGSLWMNRSLDGGANFLGETELTAMGAITHPSKNVLRELIPGSNPPAYRSFKHANPNPSAAIRRTGSSYEICLTWNNYVGAKPSVYFSKSPAGGSAWSTVRLVNTNTGSTYQEFLPAITVNNSGTIRIAYLNRVDQSSSRMNLIIAESTDGGTSFTIYGNSNSAVGNLITTGDYIGIASNGGCPKPR